MREGLQPLELDIWIPSLDKAIEFNGKYWHSLDNVISRDKIKKDQCKKSGIELLIIKEEDWMTNKEICIEKINNFLKESLGGA